MKILSGHTSPETAYVVDDYPYGFRLRCKIRYWLEQKRGHGYRLVSQTTNPKKPGEVWNKPKASTYMTFFAVMYLNHESHVDWAGLHCYSGPEGFAKFRQDFYAQLSDEQKKTVDTLEGVVRKFNPITWGEYEKKQAEAQAQVNPNPWNQEDAKASA